ncbi:MAG: histidine kinase [Bacteroidales bacterium]
MFEIERLYLSSRITPHYFTSIINSMQAHALQNKGDLPSLLEKLNMVISYMLIESIKEKVRLRDELKFYDNYVILEKQRYSSDIDYRFDIFNIDCNLLISPLLFENMISNAFKYTLHDGTGYVHITLDQPESNQLQFICTNNMASNRNTLKGKGIGLKNLRDRLELCYPKKFELISTETEQTYTITLILIF